MIKIFRSKKAAALDYWNKWAEFYTILLLVIGFLIGITVRSVALNYVIIFIAGLMGGRLLHSRKNKHKFSYYLIIIGFLLGYMLGSVVYNKKIIAFLFLSAFLISYYLHEKGIVEKALPLKDPHKELWK